jgi:catechol 2,3-dioxygenase-like lactoylglutathione lyase family enzyme
MKTWVRMRGPDAGGGKEGTPELHLGDPDGIDVQLQDIGYCGGAGPLGNLCKPPEPAPIKGLLAVRDLSHFTLHVSDTQRSTDFYQNAFGLPVQAHQGAMALLAVGANRQFVAMAGVNAALQGTPHIGHGCFTMEGFNPDRVMKVLADYGVKARGSAVGPPGPLVSYVTMRREDRGGAKGGTPELYFTDPDGILMQIQDVTYCGGSGYLGEVCA